MSRHRAIIAGGLGQNAGPTTHGNRSLAPAARALPKKSAVTRRPPCERDGATEDSFHL